MSKIIFTDETIRVKKVTVGTPIRTVTSGSFTIFALEGVDATTRNGGDILVYDSADGLYVSSRLDIGGNLTKTHNTDTNVVAIQTNLGSIAESLVPDSDITYDLGSVDKRWRDLHLSGQTITLGEITLQESGGEFVVKDASGNTILVNPKLSTNNPNILTYDSSNGTFTFYDSDIARTDVAETFHSHLTVSGDLTTIGSQIVQQNLSVLGNATVTGYLNVSDSATISSNLNVGGTLTVNGDLLVSGTTTTINTETIQLADNTIVLNSNATGAPVENAGIEVERGDSANKLLVWDENSDQWTVNGETFHAGTLDGDLLVAVNANIDSASITTLKGGAVSATTLTFDTLTNTTSDITEGANLYYTRARFDSALGDDTSIGTIRGYFTANKGLVVTDGEFNLDSANVRNIFSAAGDLTYDANTGQFSIDVEQVYSKENFDSDLGAAIAGGTGITYDSATDTISITDTGVVAGTYGSATQIPVFTVNAQGQLDSAGSVSFAGVQSFAFDSSNGNIAINTTDGNLFTTTITLDPYTTSNLLEGTNLYYTQARVDSDFDARLATKTTTNLAEGDNLYYTRGRFDSALGDATSTSTIRALFSAGGDLTYNTGTGEFTFDVEQIYTKTNFDSDLNLALSTSAVTTTQLIEGDNLYYTSARSDSDFDVRLATKSTTDVSEGVNLYYTQTRVDSAFDTRLAIKSTDDLTEGLNLYYTTARSDSDFDTRLAIKSTSDLVEGINLYYTTSRVDSAFDVRLTTKTTDNLAEGSNLYYTTVRADSDFDVRLTTKSTTDVAEGINLYYTSTRVDSDFDTRLAIKTTTDLTEGDNLYYTTDRVNTDFDTRLATKSTTDLAEGDKLYYTQARVDSAFDSRLATKSTDDLSEGLVNIYYTQQRHDSDFDARLSIKTTTNLAEGDSLYYTTARVDSDIDAAFAAKSTSNLDEGTNLYYTTARADSDAKNAVSAVDAGGDGSFSYSASTGEFTYTGPSSTEVRAHFQAGTGVTYDSASGTFSIGQAVELNSNVQFNDVQVDGNLTVSGTTTTINTEIINLADNIILINSNATGVPTQDGGIEIERGDSANKSLLWNETSNKWTIGSETFVAATFEGNLTGNVTGTVSSLSNHTTTDLAEGDNLYYTTARADSAFDVRLATKSTTNVAEGTNLYYTTARSDSDFDVRLATKSTTNLTEGDNLYYTDGRFDTRLATKSTSDVAEGSNLYYTTARADSDFDARLTTKSTTDVAEGTNLYYTTVRVDSDIDAAFVAKSTDDLSEGSTNLYYTTARADSDAKNSVSVTDNGGDGSLSYSPATGIFTYTGPSATEVRAHFVAGGDLAYDSATGVFSFTQRTDQGVRNLFSVSGDLAYDSATGQFSFTERTDQEVKNLFSVSGDLAYDSAAGQFSFTERTDQEVKNLFSVSGDLAYDSAAGQFSFTERTDQEVRNLFSVSGDLSYDSSTGQFSVDVEQVYTKANFDSDLNASSTSNLPEGTNLYYTTARADSDAKAALFVVDAGGDGSLTYDSATGVFTYTGPSAAEVRAHFSGGTGVDITDGVVSIGQAVGTSDTVTFSTVNVGTVGATNVNSTYVDADSAKVTTLTVSTLNIGGASATTLGADSATITNLATTQITGSQATFDSASVLNLRSATAILDSATIPNLATSQITGSQATLDSANIGTLLVTGNAKVDGNLTVVGDIGFDDVTADSATFTGTVSIGTKVTSPLANLDSATIGTLKFTTLVNTTSDITEGTNLYYTDGRFDTRLATKTTTDVAEGTNLYYTKVRTDSDIDAAFAAKSTSNLSEGSNLYYTSARADSDAKNAISVVDNGGDGSLAYSAATGVITYTGPSASEVRAHFSNGTGVTITNGSVAIGQSVGTTDNVTFGKVTQDSAVINQQINLTRTTVIPTVAGSLYYDSDPQKGLSFIPTTTEGSTDVTINIGQETLIYVHNLTGAQINNGQAVYVSGTAHGAHPQVSLSKSDTALTARVDGVATMDIPNGGHGYITKIGLVRDVNTGGLTAGASLYLSKDSAGQFTTTEVTIDEGYPFHIGKVIAVDSTAGSILVDPWTENYEYLRIQDRLLVTGTIEGTTVTVDSAVAFTPIDYLASPAYLEGKMWYNQDAKTLALHSADSDFTHYLGEREWVRVRNNSGALIPKGTPVSPTGVHIPGHPIHGHHPLIVPADASNASAYEVLGVTGHDIKNGAHGYVVSRGYIDGIDTTGLTTGGRIHLGTSAGTITSTAPEYPNFPMDLGYCLTADSAGANGSIYVNISDHTLETIYVTGNGRIGGSLTVGGNLNVVGSTTSTVTQNLTVTSNLVKLLSGDTLGTSYQSTGGLDDATFKGTYRGDSDLFYFVKISSVDSTGDVIEWGISDSDQMLYGSFNGTYGYGAAFDSDLSGKTSWNLISDGLTAPLREGISIQFINATGHQVNDAWCAHPTELNLDLGMIGTYNPAGVGGIKYAGVYRDVGTSRWRFFEGLNQNFDSSPGQFEIQDSAGSGYGLSDIEFGTAYGNLSGNATTATSATQLATGRNFSLTGDITASAVSFDGTGNVSLVTAIAAGSIVNADISATAAITDGKLATISTAGKVQNSATTATAANTGSAIVTRDPSGNFSAGVITADINRDAHTTVIAGTYGSTTAIPVITIDANGFVDSVGTVGVSGITGVVFDSSNGALTIQTSTGNFIDSINLSPFTTDNLAQGSTNKYYDSATTTTNARNSIGVSGDLSYSPATGIISFSETYSSASELLTAIKTVDGTTSGLDADLLDGQEGTYYRINVYNSSGTLLN